jgi:dipeptide/tripeptide permease
MAADLGTVIGPVAVGAVAQHFSYGLALALTGALLAIAAAIWALVPEPLHRRGVASKLEAAVESPPGYTYGPHGAESPTSDSQGNDYASR